MPHPSDTLKEMEEALRNVIDNLIDGQEGFKKMGDQIEDPSLKQYFFAESLDRAHFRGEIETVLHQEGVHDIKESGTGSGAVIRAWGKVKHVFGGGDNALLETAEEAEEEAAKSYEDALERDLPLPVRQLLVTQLAHIVLSKDYVKMALNSRK
jgi:uncharacterized protein (TIGR02284 family)